VGVSWVIVPLYIYVRAVIFYEYEQVSQLIKLAALFLLEKTELLISYSYIYFLHFLMPLIGFYYINIVENLVCTTSPTLIERL